MVEGFDTKVYRGEFPSGCSTKLLGVPRRVRKIYKYTGIGPQVKFGVHNNSYVNCRRALLERVFNVERDGCLVPTPRPVPGFLQSVTSRFQSQLKQYVKPLPPLTDEQFASRYHGRRRLTYEKALESLHVQGVLRKDAFIKMFVKAEKINLSAKNDPAPRAIQPRSPRYCAALGKLIAHAEKPCFRALAKVFGYKVVFKGMNAAESGAAMKSHWDAFDRPVAIGLDASRFDQHVSRDALEIEHALWELFVLPGSRGELRKLLRMQLKNFGVAVTPDGKIKYSVDGCRMSGDMNTSSGNCLIMCALVFSYMGIYGPNVKYRLANNGDDCVLFLEKRDLAVASSIPEFFSKCGFTMKVEEPVYELEQVEFCQTRPVFTSKGWVMVRDPRVAMAKDLTANCDLSTLPVRAAWTHAMRCGGLALTDGVPVWPQFYRMFPSSGVPGKKYTQELHRLTESGFAKMTQGLKYEAEPTLPESRYSFWLAFGINPDEQVALENYFRTISLNSGDPEVLPLNSEPVLPLNDLQGKLTQWQKLQQLIE